MEVNKSSRYYLLDPLRGLSAIWVFLSHFHFSDEFSERFPGFVWFAKAGHYGVPIFFVISGYCIAASAFAARRRNEPTTQFLARRFKRIYPTFWASLAFAIALPFILEILSYVKTGTYQVPETTFKDYDEWQWVRVATLTQVFYPMDGIHTLQEKFNTINAVYWSLAIEEQFYLVLAFALLLGRRFTVVIGAVTVVSLPFFLDPDSYVTGLFLAYWPMFFLGMILFYLFHAQFEPRRMFGCLARTVAVIVLGIALPILIALAQSYAVRVSHFSFALTAGVALWFARAFDSDFHYVCTGPKNVWRWSAHCLILAGAMSYTIYLMHAKFMWLADAFARQFFSQHPVAKA